MFYSSTFLKQTISLLFLSSPVVVTIIKSERYIPRHYFIFYINLLLFFFFHIFPLFLHHVAWPRPLAYFPGTPSRLEIWLASISWTLIGCNLGSGDSLFPAGTLSAFVYYPNHRVLFLQFPFSMFFSAVLCFFFRFLFRYPLHSIFFFTNPYFFFFNILYPRIPYAQLSP